MRTLLGRLGLVVALGLAPPVLEAAIHFASGVVMGRVYDLATSGWGERMIRLYRDEHGAITVIGGNGREHVEARLQSRAEAKRLLGALHNGLDLLRAAAGQRPDAIVDLARIVHGQGVDQHGVALSYLPQGPEDDRPVLLLLIQDRERPIARMELYLPAPAAQRLVALFEELLDGHV